MNIQIIGAGSVGMLFACRLAMAGHSVHIVTRTEEQRLAIAADGIQLAVDGEVYTARPFCTSYANHKAGQGAASIHGDSKDWVMLAVKQTHLDNALIRYAGEQMREFTRILCLQNGMGHIGKLSEVIPSERIDMAVTTEGALREGLNRVKHTGHGTTWIGNLREKTSKAAENKQKILAEALKMAGFDAAMSKKMESIVWNKWLINAVVNPLSAILRVRNGELAANPDFNALMRALFEEALNVARAAGVETSSDLWEQLVAVCVKTSVNRTSMLQDIAAGRKTEIEAITGSLLETGERHGMRMPMHRALYAMVRGLERTYESE